MRPFFWTTFVVFSILTVSLPSFAAPARCNRSLIDIFIPSGVRNSMLTPQRPSWLKSWEGKTVVHRNQRFRDPNTGNTFEMPVTWSVSRIQPHQGYSLYTLIVGAHFFSKTLLENLSTETAATMSQTSDLLQLIPAADKTQLMETIYNALKNNGHIITSHTADEFAAPDALVPQDPSTLADLVADPSNIRFSTHTLTYRATRYTKPRGFSFAGGLATVAASQFLPGSSSHSTEQTTSSPPQDGPAAHLSLETPPLFARGGALENARVRVLPNDDRALGMSLVVRSERLWAPQVETAAGGWDALVNGIRRNLQVGTRQFFLEVDMSAHFPVQMASIEHQVATGLEALSRDSEGN